MSTRSLALLLIAALPAVTHPLDPLTKDEYTSALTILKTAHPLPPDTSFPLILLQDPPKPDVLANRPTARRVFLSVYERPTHQSFEAVVDLTTRHVVSWNEIRDVQPPIMPEDFAICQRIVRADPGWVSAIHKRGITDMTRVEVDVWGNGYHAEPNDGPHRIVRTVSYYKGVEKSADFYPVDGLVAQVDLTTEKVIQLIDTGAHPLAAAPVLAGSKAAPLHPLVIAQPKGVSFVRNGNEVTWDHWHFRFAANAREGLVLYTVGYEDHGVLRSVLYKASLSDMVVPYGDPGPAWYFRNSFDFSEYSFVGRSMTPLVAGRDVPDNATFADADFATETGFAYTVPHAISIYERDGGLLWRYYDTSTGKIVAQRARDLVLATIVSAPPYEYGFNWVFHQDGRIGMELLLTGIMATKSVSPSATHEQMHAHLVAPDLEAVHHQHFFNFRLDMDVDGTSNSVVEMNTQGGGGKAIVTTDSPLSSEQQAKREMSPLTNRMWKVINPGRKNALGEPVGYLLVPGENTPSYADPDSSIRKRASFLNAQFWATPYDASQQYSAGNYVNQSKGGQGLTQWIQADRRLDNKDVVLWYTLGVTHIPRPEEWPIMSTHTACFELVPAGFFRSNPDLIESDIK
jgi:primary-amine oxidase